MKEIVGLVIGAAVVVSFSVSRLPASWAREASNEITPISYVIDGRSRLLSFEVVNPADKVWQKALKVVILNSRGRIKHEWVFDHEVVVSALKKGRVELRWSDNNIVIGKEKVNLYAKTGGKWVKLATIEAGWQIGSGAYVLPVGLLMGLLVIPGLTKTFPNVLVSFLRKEVKKYA
ncbi:MAG: hypothetical protein GXP43_00465 [bacterium]|nr:hypothetical protein [bacterium]